MTATLRDWNFRKLDESLLVDSDLRIPDLTGAYNRGESFGPNFFLDSFSTTASKGRKTDYDWRGISPKKCNGIWIKRQCPKFDRYRTTNPIPVVLGYLTVDKSPNSESRRELEIYLNGQATTHEVEEITSCLERRFHRPVVYMFPSEDVGGQGYFNLM